MCSNRLKSALSSIFMKNRLWKSPLFGLILVVCQALSPYNIHAQKGGAAAAGGYGKVYEAAGRSVAASEVQKNMNTTLMRAIARSRGTKTAIGSGRRANPSKAMRSLPAPSAQVNSDSAFFKPDPDSNYTETLAESLGTTSREKEYLRQLFRATKTAFEKEVSGKGRDNNLAAALTFFTASVVTVYHDDPEPSDAAIDKLWDGLNGVFEETPDIAKLSNTEKQQMYDTLIAFGGLVLAGHLLGKNSNDAEMQRQYRQLAGAMIEMVLKTKPDSVRFRDGGLKMG